MIKLSKGLSAWQTSTFNSVLKDEIEQLDAEKLPLQQGLTQGSYATGDTFSVMIISASETPDCIRVKAGFFIPASLPVAAVQMIPHPLVSTLSIVKYSLT